MAEPKIGSIVYLIRKERIKRKDNGMRIIKARCASYKVSQGSVVPELHGVGRHAKADYEASKYDMYLDPDQAVSALKKAFQ